MGIPLDQFEPESFATANPMLTGLMYGNQAAQSMIQTQYAQPMAQAQLQQAQAQPALTQAQTGLIQAQTPYASLAQLGQYYGGVGRVMAANPYSRFMQWASTPDGQAAIAANPQLAQQAAAIAQAQSGGAMGPGTGSINGMLTPVTAQGQMVGTNGQPISQMSQGSQATQMPAAPQVRGQPTQAPVLQPETTVPQYNPQSGQIIPPQPAQGSIAQAIQGAAQNAVVSTQYTKQQQQQLTYANSVSNMMQQIQPRLQNVMQYSGIKGQLNYMGDLMSSATGSGDSPAYQDYQALKGSVPLMASDIRRSFGNQATDSERQILDGLISPEAWDVSPGAQMSKLQALQQSVRANTQAITQTKAQNLQQAKNSLSTNVGQAAQSGATGLTIDPSLLSDNNLAFTAKKYGMTVQQVKQQLGITQSGG